MESRTRRSSTTGSGCRRHSPLFDPRLWTCVTLTSDRIMAGLAGDGDPAQLGEGLDPGLTAEAAVAGGADAPEGHLRLVVHRRPVHVADARSNAPCDAKTARGIAGEHCRRKAVVAVVGD